MNVPHLGTDPRSRWEPSLAHYFPGTMPWTLMDLTRPELGSMILSLPRGDA